MIGTIFTLAEAAPAGPQGGLLSFLPMILIFGVMIFFMFRSQRKQAKKRAEMVEQIKKGDSVIIGGGIYAKIVEVKDKTFIAEISDNVKIEISKTAINAVFENGNMNNLAN
jgi:preprotein translocase subunit YajC